MNKKILFPLIIAAALTGCTKTITPTTAVLSSAKTIDAAKAFELSYSILEKQKNVVVSNKTTLHEDVQTEQYEYGKLKEKYTYTYLMNLNRETGFYHTDLYQESEEFDETIKEYVNYIYDIKVYIWTDEAYRTTLCQNYVKYRNGLKITDEKIYAVWNLGYYQDNKTVFGKGKFACTLEILNHLFSGSVDAGEEADGTETGEYNVKNIVDNYLSKEALNDSLSAAAALKEGKKYAPYTDAYNFTAQWSADEENDFFGYARSFDVAFDDVDYGYIVGTFDLNDEWTKNICTAHYDHRVFHNDIFHSDQIVNDSYTIDDFTEETPDPEKEGYTKLDLNY